MPFSTQEEGDSTKKTIRGNKSRIKTIKKQISTELHTTTTTKQEDNNEEKEKYTNKVFDTTGLKLQRSVKKPKSSSL